jgi:soluble lytic murein transglycosylase-like protein
MGLPAWVADLANRTAPRHGVDAALVRAVIRAESGGDPNARSPAGANGVMQVLDGPFDPAANVEAGTRYLAAMLARFGAVDLALAAYNAGPGAVERFGGIPPYAETRAYVPRVLGYYAEERSGPAPAPAPDPGPAPLPWLGVVLATLPGPALALGAVVGAAILAEALEV